MANEASHISSVYFHQTELPAVAAIMHQSGFGEAAFWRLYFFLRQTGICFDEFWESSNYSFFPIHNKIIESIKKFKKEYKNNEYFEWLAEQQVSVFFCTDDSYPPLLKTIDLPPPVIYGKGTPIETHMSLAIIGSRQMTNYGRLVISNWLPELIRAQIPIVSGAVRGVDRTVQQLALDYGGSTIAVLGHGLLGTVSNSQQKLLADWEAAGAWLISCFAPNVDPSKGTFLARNRVVAGMSKTVLVIEAAMKSGTLHTANWTAEFGRQLLAVPGSVFNQFSDGTAALVNQGANLVTRAAEVISLMQDCSSSTTPNSCFPELETTTWSAVEKAVWEEVRAGEIQLHTLTTQLATRFNLSELLTAITKLEIQKLITQQNGWLLANKHGYK